MLTDTLPTVGGATNSVAVPKMPFGAVAVMVTDPSTTPRATPPASIVAIVGSELTHVNVVGTTRLFASRAVAPNDFVPPTVTDVLPGDTVTAVISPGGRLTPYGPDP